MGIVGGFGVPNLSRVAPVGVVPPGDDVHVAVVLSVGAPVGGTPLPLGGGSVVGAC